MRMRQIRRTLLAGFGLALGLTFFIDLAILVVPLYDMQLYDRVLMSHNMDTVFVLSVSCMVGLLFYGALDYLRSTAFLAVADTVALRLNGPALEEGIRRAAAGDKRAGPQLARDVHELQSFLASGAVATPLDALCAPLFVSVLFLLHPAFGFLAVFGIAGLVLAGLASEALLHPVLHRAQDRRRAADHALSNSLSELEVTEGLGMLPAIARRWCLRYAHAVSALRHASTIAEIVAGLSRLLRFALQASVMALGAVLIIRGQTTPGTLMGANLLVSKAYGPFDHLVGSCRSWLLARGAWQRLTALIPNTPEACVAPTPLGTEPGLHLHGVSLTAGSRGLFREVDLHVPPGTLAVVRGPNGSGKTTLLRMLAGIVPPNQGTLTLDGAPLPCGLDLGYLPQSVSLLDGTVAANIARLQDDLPGAIAAARQAALHEQIGRLSAGYDTQLTGNGGILSGGMRQRVGLARALFGRPRLLLLDEPDASLDSAGSDALLRAIRECCAEGTIAVVISHRPALLHDADLIIEIVDGRVISAAAPVRGASSKLEIA